MPTYPHALCAVLCAAVGVGCTTAAQHQASLGSTAEREMTLGVVQKEIRAGLTQEQVVLALGSPNIVTTDEERREVWIYDKIATEAAYSTSSGGISALLVGIGSSIGGAGNASASQSTGATSTSQRTLTVVIKFDADRRVRDFAYHTSSF